MLRGSPMHVRLKRSKADWWQVLFLLFIVDIHTGTIRGASTPLDGRLQAISSGAFVFMERAFFLPAFRKYVL